MMGRPVALAASAMCGVALAEQGYPQRYQYANHFADEDEPTNGIPTATSYGPNGYQEGTNSASPQTTLGEDGHSGYANGLPTGTYHNPASESAFNPANNNANRYLVPIGPTGTPGYGGGPLVDQDYSAGAVCPRPKDFCDVKNTKDGAGPSCWSPELDYDWRKAFGVDSCCGDYKKEIMCSYVADKSSGLTWCYCHDVSDKKTNDTEVPKPCCFWDYYPTKDLKNHPYGGNFVARAMHFDAADFYPSEVMKGGTLKDGTTVWGVQNEYEDDYMGNANKGPSQGRKSNAGDFGYIPQNNDHQSTQPLETILYSNWHNNGGYTTDVQDDTDGASNGIGTGSETNKNADATNYGWDGGTVGGPWWAQDTADNGNTNQNSAYGDHGYDAANPSTWASLVQQDQNEIIPSTSAIMPAFGFGAAPLISFIQKQQRESIGADADAEWDPHDFTSAPGSSYNNRNMYAHNDQWGIPTSSHETSAQMHFDRPIEHHHQQAHPSKVMRGSMNSHAQQASYYFDEDEESSPNVTTANETSSSSSSDLTWNNAANQNTWDSNNASATYYDPSEVQANTSEAAHDSMNKCREANTKAKCDEFAHSCGWLDDHCQNTTGINVITHDDIQVVFDQSCNEVAFKIDLANIACNQNTVPGHKCAINTTNARSAMCVDLDKGGFTGVDYTAESIPFQGSCCQTWNPNQLECRVFCLSNDNNKSDFHFAYGVFAWNKAFADREKNAHKTYRMQKNRYSFLQTGDNSEIEVEIELDQDQNDFGYQGDFHFGNKHKRDWHRYETHPHPKALQVLSQSSAEQQDTVVADEATTDDTTTTTTTKAPDTNEVKNEDTHHIVAQENGHKYWNRACCAYMLNVEQADGRDGPETASSDNSDDDGTGGASSMMSAFALFVPFVALFMWQ